MIDNDNVDCSEDMIDSFREANEKDGLRVFVAGGSRSGDDEEYVEEAYKLGKKIVKLGFRLDFGLSSAGIMGATAKGALDGWRQIGRASCRERVSSPV